MRGEIAGSGPAVVQLHGLTAARRYVTHGSRALERSGFQPVLYDARGHGESDPAPQGEGYTYAELAADLGAVLEAQGGGGAVILAGHSMGAHTATAYALSHPEQVAGLIAIGPTARGEPPQADSVAYWDRLADGVEAGGVEGFIAAYDDGTHNPDWRETILRITRQRLELHRDLGAVARALREVPRSRPFEGIEALEGLDVPVLVVASHDEADPGHPYATSQEWVERIPRARLVSEQAGESPLAWQGGKLSREIAAFCEETAVKERLG